MAQLEWDKIEDRQYEQGLDRGVLYPAGGTAAVWNGLVSVGPEISRDVRSWYQDGIKMFEHSIPKPFSAKVQAYTYPDVLDTLMGGKVLAGVLFHEQPAGRFGLAYRTLIGDAVNGVGVAYKLHFIYNVTASPNDLTQATLGDRGEVATMGFSLSAIPVPMAGLRPASYLSLDSREVSPQKLSQIEQALYGTSSSAPYLPTPAQLVS